MKASLPIAHAKDRRHSYDQPGIAQICPCTPEIFNYVSCYENDIPEAGKK